MVQLMHDNGFPHRFSARPAAASDVANLPRFVFGCGEGRTSGVDSLEIRFDPNESCAWVGSFRNGDGGLVGVYPTPSASWACVVAHARAYLVNVIDPPVHVEVSVEPVLAVLADTRRGLLLLNDFCSLCACSETGILWTSVLTQ